jgi:hypothetical protein
MIQAIALWYLIGFMFYLIYMGCRFDNIIRDDVKNAFVWGLLGPVWAIIVILWSVRDTFNNHF